MRWEGPIERRTRQLASLGWHWWFAWHPVFIYNNDPRRGAGAPVGRYHWLEFVERLCLGSEHGYRFFEYR